MRLKRLFGALIGTALLTLGVVAVNESVKEKVVNAASVTFAPSDFSGQGTSGTGSAISASKDGVSFSCDKGYGTTQIRCYSGGKITISALSNITSISFTFSGSNNGGLETSYMDISAISWEKSLSSQARITSLTVITEDLDEYQTALNNIDASMKLGYSYNYETHSEEKDVVDRLNRSFTNVTGPSYTDWSGKSGSDSNAIYSGNSAGGNSSIQLRSDKSTSGIITTTSGGKAKKVTVEWNSNTANGRTLNVYGKSTAYTQATDLYNVGSQGTLLGTIVYGTSTELNITGDYEYIGLKSASGAMYLTSIDVTWYGTTEVTTYSNSKFTLSVGIDSSISNINEIYEAGIYVEAAGGKTEKYPLSGLRNGGNYLYTTIGLGELLNDSYKERSEVTFTVKAYLIVNEGDEPKYSVKSAEYSVQSLIDEYLRRSKLDDSDEDYIELSDEEKENLELVKGLLS